uniref:Pentatricopeptide repeat-containing protein n=1 Tax=Kalanchoe fedtschenkoi TaxID=63787 RepID=A0A7N0UU35_KALFE
MSPSSSAAAICRQKLPACIFTVIKTQKQKQKQKQQVQMYCSTAQIASATSDCPESNPRTATIRGGRRRPTCSSGEGGTNFDLKYLQKTFNRRSGGAGIVSNVAKFCVDSRQPVSLVNSLLIDLFKTGRYEDAIGFYRKMSCNKVGTDSKSLSVLMNCYSKLGCVGYGFGAVGLVLKMGFAPNRIGVSCLLNCLCEEGRINEAVMLFRKMKEAWGCAPDEVSYGTLVKGLCATGNSEVAFKLHRLIVDGTSFFGGDVQVNCICYSTLIDGVCKDGRWDRANELFLEMRSKGVEPNVVTYSSMIDGLCRGGKWDEAKAMFYEMLDQGIQPNVVTFNVLINALAKMRKGKEAKELMDLMVKRGEEPNVRSYSSLMECFYKEGDVDEVQNVFISLESKGIEPNVVTYNILIKAYCKECRIDEAITAYNQMIEKGLKPNIVTVNTLLEGMLLKGMVNDAQKLKNELEVHNLTPNMVTYTILVDGLCKNNCIQEALELFFTIKNRRFRLGIEIYSCSLKKIIRNKFEYIPKI